MRGYIEGKRSITNKYEGENEAVEMKSEIKALVLVLEVSILDKKIRDKKILQASS